MENKELNMEEMNDYETVILELDNGSEEEFAILESFEMEGQAYVLLALIKDDTVSDNPDEMLFMRDESDDTCGEGEIILTVIESDEEYEKVVDFYTASEED